MSRPTFLNPVAGPRIVPFGIDREPADKLPNGRAGFRVTATAEMHATRKPPLDSRPAIDLGNYRAGDAVTASAPGVVSLIKPSEGVVRVEHGGGWSTGYAHMSNIAVTLGQTVGPSTVLGRVGKTGTDEVHLHFDITRDGQRLDPWPLLAQNGPDDSFETLGALIVLGGTNVRQEASMSSEHYFIASDSPFDLLGYKPHGGAWSTKDGSGTAWYRVRRQLVWWVYAGGVTDIRLNDWALSLLPPADCTPQDNKLAAARTALAGYLQAHDASAGALDALSASLTED